MKIRSVVPLLVSRAFALPPSAQQYRPAPCALLIGYAAGSSTDIVAA